jgi:indolepyruvate ferredoxin oxidoreductase alpha subunit
VKERLLMSGNEAIARGAYEAGVSCGMGYPGTPSTEILENFVKYPGVYAEWSTNEKVALEAATGVSLAGARALVTMKHVGLNVALDAFMTLAYTGINAGLVVVSADDPDMHSSQNEQDNRVLGRFAGVPVIEPSSSQEAKDFMIQAFDISEEFGLPVLFRITTRTAHSKSVVEAESGCMPARIKKPLDIPWEKYVMMPMNARKRRQELLKKQELLAGFAEKTGLNTVEPGSKDMGIITSGIAYQYVKEIFPKKSIFKLGLLNPLAIGRIKKFAAKVKKLYVVEELEPFIEEQLKAAGIKVIGKDIIPVYGELNPDIVSEAFKPKRKIKDIEETIIPARPPVLCPGCPHRGVFYALSKLGVTVTGDIGCYTLGALPPLSAMNTCIDMGAAINHAYGIEKAGEPYDKVAAVIGDSTFIHSGITGIVNLVYNKGNTLVIILDNRTTAMTGTQPHPGAGPTLAGDETTNIDMEKLVAALGVKEVAVIDPYNLRLTENVIKDFITKTGPKVIIARRECVLIDKRKQQAFYIDRQICDECGKCMELGCPAIEKENGTHTINPGLCTGCAMCVVLCPKKAIKIRKI